MLSKFIKNVISLIPRHYKTSNKIDFYNFYTQESENIVINIFLFI